MVGAVVAVGRVPDEVVLLCGRPDSLPTAWWTPTLVDRPEDDARRLTAAAAQVLDAAGVRDAATGALSGVLGEVADVVAAARVLVLLESEGGDGEVVRRAVVASRDRALLDRLDADEGFHDLLLAAPDAAAALLADLLAPPAAPTTRVQALAGVRTTAEVATALPLSERRATTRIIRTVGGDDPGAHLLTVIVHPDGTVACWARRDGTVDVHPLDEDAAVATALALLGAEVGEVAA